MLSNWKSIQCLINYDSLLPEKLKFNVRDLSEQHTHTHTQTKRNINTHVYDDFIPWIRLRVLECLSHYLRQGKSPNHVHMNSTSNPVCINTRQLPGKSYLAAPTAWHRGWSLVWYRSAEQCDRSGSSSWAWRRGHRAPSRTRGEPFHKPRAEGSSHSAGSWW